MKKIIAFLIVLIIFIGGSFYTYNYFYGGETYYTKIVSDGEKSTETAENGDIVTFYTYNQAAYNDDGQEKDVTLHEARENPLKMDAYLKMVVNDRKGVISWEEVTQADLPTDVEAELNS